MSSGSESAKSSVRSSNSSNSSNSSDNDNTKQGECIRNRSNFSIVKSFHMIDKKDFNPEMLQHYMQNDASPKLTKLLEYIHQLDAKDMEASGKMFKHLIFTDVNRSAYGAKIIASALAAKGMNMVFHPQGKGFSVYDNEELLKTAGNNFAVLLSKSFYDRPMNAKIRKALLDKFNSRPDNVQGDLVRFIILDQGFKEGIDLFDVKYVHLFEPLTVKADEKQAIGRATRFCGQKGLEFHPRFGWPLYVFLYDTEIPGNHRISYSNAESLFELYLKYSNLDMRKIIFASELEKATIGASVDYDLTRTIHTFNIDDPSPILKGGVGSKAPEKIMNLKEMRQYITKYFMRNRYPRIRLENNCVSGGANVGNLVNFTPTQDFIRQYFQPESAYKGILLHHSVGTGKTCTAIATATSSFDTYTILWVTRHTLKSDIWKNMFGQVCNVDIQRKIQEGLKLSDKMGQNMKHVSNNWMEPISYKQFSNMLLKKNKIYNQIVARNGEEDPLRKTLLIIDEAHKLYSPTVAKSERPNTDVLEKMIQNSYDKSGKDSVRVMLMTATPFTEDGMEMIQLLNLLRNDKLPTKFDEFGTQYLDENGYFTKLGMQKFQDQVSGYISYLNRSQDARNFAHPVIQKVNVAMSFEKNDTSAKELKDLQYTIKMLKNEEKETAAECIANCNNDKKCIKTCKEMARNEQKYNELNAKLRELKKLNAKSKYDSLIDDLKDEIKSLNYKGCAKDAKDLFKGQKSELTEKKKGMHQACKELPVKERKGCKEKADAEFDETITGIQQTMRDSLQGCESIKNKSQVSKNKINEYKELKKADKAELKALKVRASGFKTSMKEFSKESRYLALQVKTELKKIRNIKDTLTRKAALKDFRTNSEIVKKSKQIKQDIKNARAEASKLNILIKNKRLSDGSMKLKKISQQYALSKYCKV
jgi:hypothetical protein